MFKESMPDIALTSLTASWPLILSVTLCVVWWLQWGQARCRAYALQRSDRSLTLLKNMPLITLIVLTSVGLARAWSLMWIGDDAFISLRYSDMFAQGEGLVFNRGEWVEGYTNFLWTWGLGVLAQIGAPLPQSALIGDLLSFIGVIIITAQIGARVRLGFIPAIVMTSAYPCVVFATSGLETMPATFLVLCGAYALICHKLTWAGVFFIGAALMRPDHLLFWGCGGLSVLFTDLSVNSGRLLGRFRWLSYLKLSAPLVLIYLPYFLWRVSAYDAWFPNTYYAKSGHLTYWAQGGVYLASFLLGCGVWWLLGSSVFLGVKSWISKTRTSDIAHASLKETSSALEAQMSSQEHLSLTRSKRQLYLFCGLSICIFGGYVVRVGGDFMLYRFFVVLLPLCWLIYPFLKPQGLGGRIALGIAIALAVTPVELVKYQKKKWKLAAEETFYQVRSFQPLELSSRYARIGHDLGLLRDQMPNELRIAADCVGMVGYYSRARIFDLFGLTSPRVAHRPLTKRGRPGHEKYGNLNDALAERSVLSTVDLWGRARYRDVEFYTRFKVKSSKFYLLRYDPKIYAALKQLRARGVKVTMPSSPKIALIRVKNEIKRGQPQRRLVKFLRIFYADVLPAHRDLNAAIQTLEGLKTSTQNNLKSRPRQSARP